MEYTFGQNLNVSRAIFQKVFDILQNAFSSAVLFYVLTFSENNRLTPQRPSRTVCAGMTPAL